VGEVEVEDEGEKGTTAAIVHTPKLWNTCLGVRNDTDVRPAK
jgi:hypothetical protein